jgi:hypothetical protein
MGKTFSTGLLTNGLWQDASNNIGIGGSPSGSFKFEVTGASRFWDGTQGLNVRAYTGGAGFGAIYSTGVTPGAGNFALAASSTATILSGVDNVSLAINSATRLYINNAGNVGIGTNSPSVLLHAFNSSGTAELRLERGGVGDVGMRWRRNGSDLGYVSNADWIIAGASSTDFVVNAVNNLLLGTGATERMRITSGGNIQIDNAQLNTPKSLYFAANSNTGGSLGDISWYNYQWDGLIRAQIKGETDTGLSNGRLTFWTGGGGVTERMRISANGIVSMYGDLYVGGQGYKPGGGSWANSSDIRLKENVKTIDNALDKILQLRGVTFDWKEGYTEFGKKESAGFIADEVMEIFPEWVAETNASDTQKEIIEDDKIKSLSLPFHFDALLVEAIKELSAKVSALENKS